jgi:hypothetical protein
MQEDPRILPMRVLVDMIEALCVERAGSPYYSMDLIFF